MVKAASGITVLAVAQLACVGEQVTFDHLRGADRIEVVATGGRVIREIQDPSTISAAHALVSRHDSGWSTPWYGTRIPILVVTFYRGDRLMGGFGLGRDFLTTDPGPRFMARSIPREESVRILGALGVEEAEPGPSRR